MNPGRPQTISVGGIIVEVLLLAETIRSIQAGELSLIKWCMIVVASAILGILFVKLYKKRREQERRRCGSTKVEDHADPDVPKEN